MERHYLNLLPEQVYTAGQQVTGRSADASGLASRYLSQLAQTAAGVHHPQVAAAVSRYRDTWQPLVNQVSASIDELGGNTGTAAVTVAGSDQDAAQLIERQATAGGQQTSWLNRNLNAATLI